MTKQTTPDTEAGRRELDLEDITAGGTSLCGSCTPAGSAAMPEKPRPENWPIGVKPTNWEQVAETILAGPSDSLWWLSFTDPDRSAPPGQQVPGGGGFLGVAICEGDTLADAITLSHLLGVNPGGQIAARGPLPAWMIEPQWRDRLLTKDEALSIPDPTGGDDE